MKGFLDMSGCGRCSVSDQRTNRIIQEMAPHREFDTSLIFFLKFITLHPLYFFICSLFLPLKGGKMKDAVSGRPIVFYGAVCPIKMHADMSGRPLESYDNRN